MNANRLRRISNIVVCCRESRSWHECCTYKNNKVTNWTHVCRTIRLSSLSYFISWIIIKSVKLVLPKACSRKPAEGFGPGKLENFVIRVKTFFGQKQFCGNPKFHGMQSSICSIPVYIICSTIPNQLYRFRKTWKTRKLRCKGSPFRSKMEIRNFAVC